MAKLPRPIDQIIDLHQQIRYFYHEDYDLKREEVMSYNDDTDKNAFKANDQMKIKMHDASFTALAETIKSTKVYTSQAQMKMFRKYNCLKHVAELTRNKLVEPPLSEIKASDIQTWFECQKQFSVIRNKLLQNNMKLLLFCVSHAMERVFGLEYEQTVSDCTNRMFTIVDSYNPNLNFQFSTYLHRSIGNYICQLSKLSKRHETRFPTCGDKDLTEYSHSPDEHISLVSDIQMIEDAMTILDEREILVLRNRFGIGTQEMTLKGLGAQLGITRERVRQIEIRAINKIRIELSLKNKDHLKQLAKLITY